MGHFGSYWVGNWLFLDRYKNEIFVVGSFQLFKLNNHMFCFGISGLIRRGIHKCH